MHLPCTTEPSLNWVLYVAYNTLTVVGDEQDRTWLGGARGCALSYLCPMARPPDGVCRPWRVEPLIDRAAARSSGAPQADAVRAASKLAGRVDHVSS